ncbi:hypothetical protein SOCE26_046460 [Sorangium cellulosum]|uniref:Uncharacterized protein n=1 Tax=Sorangium cellulosum TaxID=56 RepID=A0A2L0EV98_SORCE|nr:hypothetical protein [Sorangium cellulosum]AUX43202.1 hypothetical protein SOCE26_046460 [Sorangium cellulosum]
MSYTGTERRRHRVFITRNTEYHVRDDVCVAVRDRAARKFRTAHLALHLKLQGGIRINENGVVIPEPNNARVGSPIYFTQTDHDGLERQIVTSRVERIERPERQLVQQYPS